MVVPISKSPPAPLPPLHVLFEAGKYDFLHRLLPCWAKCSMVYSVYLQRLDRLRQGINYATPSISPQDLQLVRRAVALSAGIEIDTLR